MDITSLGHSSFKLKGKNAVVITDPFDPKKVGLKYPSQEADIVTVSHNHGDHNFIEAVKARNEEVENRPFVINGPGEYEVGGVNILGVTTFHDNTNGDSKGLNTVYEIRMDGLVLVHLGDLGHKLTDKQCEILDSVDILFIHVGGTNMNLQDTLGVVTQLEPKIVIPMHYQVPGINENIFGNLLPVDDFLKLAGKNDLAPLDKLTVSRDKLPEEMQIVILK